MEWIASAVTVVAYWLALFVGLGVVSYTVGYCFTRGAHDGWIRSNTNQLTNTTRR